MLIEEGFPPVSIEDWQDSIAREGRSPGKGLFTLADNAGIPVPQPWPAKPCQIWAEIPDGHSAQQVLDLGAEAVVAGGKLLTREHSEPLNATEFPHDWPLERQIAEARGFTGTRLIVPVSPAYFQEIAKFRAIRRLRPELMLIARTSRYFETAYEPHMNLLRATAEAMAAIAGGCDALIVGPFTGARGESSPLADRLAVNTQLLLRFEAGFHRVADPGAGSWYIESLTSHFLTSAASPQAKAPVLIGVNRHPNAEETLPPGASITPNRASSRLELCRFRSEQFARSTGQRPRIQLILGSDAKMARIRAGFVKGFFSAGGFAISDEPADIAVLCDADANYPAFAAAATPHHGKLIVAGPESPIPGIAGFVNARSDHAATIEYWQKQMGIE